MRSMRQARVKANRLQARGRAQWAVGPEGLRSVLTPKGRYYQARSRARESAGAVQQLKEKWQRRRGIERLLKGMAPRKGTQHQFEHRVRKAVGPTTRFLREHRIAIRLPGGHIVRGRPGDIHGVIASRYGRRTQQWDAVERSQGGWVHKKTGRWVSRERAGQLSQTGWGESSHLAEVAALERAGRSVPDRMRKGLLALAKAVLTPRQFRKHYVIAVRNPQTGKVHRGKAGDIHPVVALRHSLPFFAHERGWVHRKTGRWIDRAHAQRLVGQQESYALLTPRQQARYD
jgi:hypothetical protein